MVRKKPFEVDMYIYIYNVNRIPFHGRCNCIFPMDVEVSKRIVVSTNNHDSKFTLSKGNRLRKALGGRVV